MILSYREKRYWKRVMFANEIIGAIMKDGLVYMFEKSDIAELLNMLPSDDEGWYFNESKDRYCAEKHHSGRILVNPSQVSHWFGMPVVWE